MANWTTASSILASTPILDDRFSPANLLQTRLATGLIEFIEPVKTIPAETHDLAGTGYTLELLAAADPLCSL
jgi:hypothetical protein